GMTGTSFSWMRVRKRPPARRPSGGGPSRARTGDLVAASDALSQLSYGPLEPLQCSSELEIPRPVDPGPLVVAARLDPQLDGRPPDGHLGREKIRRAEIRAVGGDCIDLTYTVGAVGQAVPPSSASLAPNHDDVVVQAGRFALDAEERRPQVEDQVVRLVVER